MAGKFEILGEFYTARTAREECTRLLNWHKDEPNGIVIGNYFCWLKDAFEKHHYNPKQKIPSPIVKIWVEASSSGFNFQFHFEMENGNQDHIGFSSKCFVTENMRTKIINEDNVVDAARQVIRIQQDDARKNFRASKYLTCALCGGTISADELHADHTPPDTFKEIFDSWLEMQSLRKCDVEYIDIAGSQIRDFLNPEQRESWFKYHASRFNPQPAHAHCNLRQGQGS